MNIALPLILISAASLAFQATLTRFFSLSQGHHFAFMAISLALLGIGASGTYLSLKQPSAATWQRTFTGGTVLFTLSVPAAYVAINYLPFDAYQIAWDRTQFLWLVLYYLSLTVPFFFSGLVIGVVLAVQPERAGSLYAANLLGAGLGPPLALFAMAVVGGPGTVFFCTFLGWLSVLSSRWSVFSERSAVAGNQLTEVNRWLRSTQHAARITFYALIPLLLLYLTLRPPALFDVQLTPYKSLFQAQLYPGSEVAFSRWNAFSRVDVLQSDGIRSAPGLSFTYPGQLPPQLGLLIDGDNLSPITHPSGSDFTRYLPLAVAFQLRPAANVLILEPGGGLGVLTALENGAQSVTVVQSNHTAIEAVARHLEDFGQNLYADARVTVVINEPRSFLRRTEQQFDLIITPLTDSFRPVTAGAYTLGEDYHYTVEAFAAVLDHLSPEGLLVAERWLQLPPSESLRLWGTVAEAVRQANDGRPAANDRLAALRSLQTSLVIAGRSSLSAEDLSTLRQFATKQQFDLIWLPDIRPDEANRYSVVPEAVYHQTFTELLTAADSTAFFADYPYAVAPPTDDHPFFFHFFKWQQTPEILQSLGKTWQPFGGSGYLVLVILLGLVVVLSAVLILLPLLTFSGRGAGEQGGGGEISPLFPRSSAPLLGGESIKSERKLLVRYLLYFGLLGLGFLFIEIPLLQHFILYLGQPAYSFAVVISTLLVAGGIGSRYLSGRLSLRLVLPLIALAAVVYPLLLPHLFNLTLPLPFTGRIVITVLVLVPLGMLLGVPFPRGLTLVGQTSPQFAPWVWAVNGCASVVSAVLAAMIALTWGFLAVLWGAALAYGLAGVVIRKKEVGFATDE